MPSPSPRARTWSRFRRAKGAPAGFGGSTPGGGPLWSDAYRSRRGPSPTELVEAFKSVLFTFSAYNKKAVCATPLRLYATTSGGQDRPKSYLGCKGVGRWKGQWLRRRDYLCKMLAGTDEVEEVTGEHPVLQSLQEVNPFMDPVQLLGHTVTSLDIIGTAYWQPTLTTIDGARVPDELWALPAQAIWPVPDGVSLVPKGYQYFSRVYGLDELVRFVNPSLRNPYMDGMSPARAAINYARLEDEFISDVDNFNSNGPRPKVIVTSRDPNGSIGDNERKRLRQEFNAVSARGRMGGVVIADGNLDVHPITYQNLDPGVTVLSEYALERLANALDIPTAFYSKETNLANMQAAREWHSENGVEPRCKQIAATLTRYVHRLDPGDRRGWSRLFFAFDPVIEADKKAAAEQHKTYVDMGVMNRDSVALEVGLDPLPDGLGRAYTVAGAVTSLDAVVNPPEPPAPAPGGFGGGPASKSLEGDDRFPFGVKADRGTPDEGAIPRGDRAEDHEDNTFDLPNGKPIGAELRRWYRRIAREVLGTLPAIGAPVPNDFPRLTDYADPMAAAMTPILGLYWDEAGKVTRGRLGLDPDEWRVVDPHLHEMIETQSIDLCRSTLQTTTLSVQDAYARLRSELAESLVTEGESGPALRKRVQGIFTELSRSGADRIARTEASRAVHAASEQSAKESGVVSGKVWLLSSNACPLCHKLEAASKANPVPLGGEFASVGNNPTYSSVKMPPGHPRCLLPHVPINAPNAVAGVEVHYDGPVVRLEFSDGSEVSVTPNHMLLTPTGFAPAHALVEGDDVIRCEPGHGPLASDPDHDGKPVRVDEVVHSLAVAGGVRPRRVPVAPEYLHGDAAFCQGEIEVVGADGALAIQAKAGGFEPDESEERGLVRGQRDGLGFAADGLVAEILEGLRLATDGGVSLLRERKAILWAHSRHAEKVGLTPPATNHAHPFEVATEGRPGDTEPLADAEFGFPGLIGGDGIGRDGNPAGVVASAGPDLDPGLDQSGADWRHADAERLRDALERFPGHVAACKVVRVEGGHYVGSVYDVETTSTLYTMSNGIVSSNCRCSVTFRLTPEYQALVDANPPEGFAPGPLGPEPRPEAKPRPEPAPAAAPPKPKPGEPILPGRPIAERIAAYEEGDRIAAELVARKSRVAELGEARLAAMKAIDTLVSESIESGLSMRQMPDDWKRRMEGATSAAENLDAEWRAAAVKAGQAVKELLTLPESERAAVRGHGVDVYGKTDLKGRATEYADRVAAMTRNLGYPVEFDWKVIPATAEQRDYHMPLTERDGSRSSTVNLTRATQGPVIAHEVTHAIEWQNPGLHRRVLEFLEHRCGDEKPVKLRGLFPNSRYEDHELGRKDRFDRAFDLNGAYYVGKVYRSENSEVLTMGVQKLFEDPAGFAERDPEYFKFIIGILRGELR